MYIFASKMNIYSQQMKAKLQRQVAIRNIVSQNRVTSQDQLLMLLKRKGFDYTQATLSRDIKLLKIVKTPDNQDGYVYVLPKEQSVATKQSSSIGSVYLADGFLSIDFSGNMAVIRTKPAFAGTIAVAIDEAVSFEIIGTIAGDDTIFLVLREGVERKDVVSLLEKIMPSLKGKLI
jgi:transcriptional regulator of arginine metabolism